MTAWTSDEINTIGAAHEVELATLRPDGTLRKPVTVWVVRHGVDLYVRSWRGRTAAWFRGAQDRREGHIQAGGVDKEVLFIQPTTASTTRSTPRTAPSTTDTPPRSSRRW